MASRNKAMNAAIEKHGLGAQTAHAQAVGVMYLGENNESSYS